MAASNPYSVDKFVTNGWLGYFPLWQAFIRYYVIGRLALFAVAFLLVTFLGFFGWFFAIVLWLPYYVWSYVTLWKCAFNSDYPALGYVVRIAQYLEAVYLLFNPDILTIAF